MTAVMDRSFASTVLPSHIRTARWISFCNCRTLPGQSNDRNTSRGRGENPLMFRPAWASNRLRKALASGRMSSRRSRNGGRWIVNGADAVKEVLAQFARLDRLVGLAVGRGDDAAIGLVTGASADGPDFLFLEDAQQLALRVDRHFGNFIQQKRAALGLPEQALRGPRVAPVKAPLTEPNNSLSINSRGSAAQLILISGPLLRGLKVWIRSAMTSLPVPLSPGDENGNVARGDSFDGAHDRFHGRALENRRFAAAHGGQGLAQRTGFLVQARCSRARSTESSRIFGRRVCSGNGRPRAWSLPPPCRRSRVRSGR